MGIVKGRTAEGASYLSAKFPQNWREDTNRNGAGEKWGMQLSRQLEKNPKPGEHQCAKSWVVGKVGCGILWVFVPDRKTVKESIALISQSVRERQLTYNCWR